MDLHHQPSDSESDAPLIELWGHGNGVGCRICPDVSSFTRRVHDLLCQADLDEIGGPSEDLHPMRFPSHDLFSKQSRHARPVWDPWRNWSVRLELHQHLTGYEPGALLLSYRPKMEERSGLAPDKTWIANKRLDCFGMRSVIRKDGLTDGICTRSATFTGSNAAITLQPT